MIFYDKTCFPASGNIYLQLKLKMEDLLAKRTFIKIIFKSYSDLKFEAMSFLSESP